MDSQLEIVLETTYRALENGPTLAYPFLCKPSGSNGFVRERAIATVAVSMPLHIHGVESLMVVEMQNWCARLLKIDVAIFEIFGSATAWTLGRAVAKKLESKNRSVDLGTSLKVPGR
ncbi:predicted protein [Coccidioides posadasii str. Silveira]|uniref:Predicted protein n=2 Tax=Coccidioides posadasii TaxID=199306 RepID=E9CZ49_COCPS|nr:predicted protein [Coccidioides posadasii str. Silveira]KMM72939.1 hypothetical protein CPAG_09229 [Coccidioides posadasii RMSCC 3488]